MLTLNHTEVDPHPEPVGDVGAPGTTEGSTSVELAQLIGQLDIAALQGWQVELAATVADLAAAADMPWPDGPDDPTVALLRVVARISLAAPEARSEVAQQLIEALRAQGVLPKIS